MNKNPTTPLQYTILVTGGAGFIGSSTTVELLKQNFEVIVLDNLMNSSLESLRRVKELTGKTVKFYKVDVALQKEEVDKVFSTHTIHAVIHFAGLKAVGESANIPLKYYMNNLTSTLNLLEVMEKYNVKNLVFSSSATVYGDPAALPVKETTPLQPATNPYGKTKLFQEEIMRDMAKADPSWNVALLRYFNPVGAHESGLMGEDPRGTPNNLMPFVAQVAVGRLPKVRIFGNDYPTPDGTGVRDYLHITDLALAHLAAVRKLLREHVGCQAYNLGTGRGYSVLEMIQAMQKACGHDITHEVVARRPGDVASMYTDPSFAERELGWRASRTLDDMCRDLWRWQSANPNGYSSSDGANKSNSHVDNESAKM